MHIPEALYRLIECYTSLGLVKQSLYIYKILKYNFPKSDWQKGSKRYFKNQRYKKKS